MNRAHFEHAIRAAGAVLGEDEVLVIDSQAIHASIEGPLFPEAERSIEVDVSSLHDEDGHKADRIDGTIGELSIFQDTFGYYAQGVTPGTAILPAGWRERLIPFKTPATNGVTALCLEPHDLWLSKAIAGRPKDLEFCRALQSVLPLDPDTLRTRIEQVPDLEAPVLESVRARISSEIKSR